MYILPLCRKMVHEEPIIWVIVNLSKLMARGVEHEQFLYYSCHRLVIIPL